jgi:hypothetical protein
MLWNRVISSDLILQWMLPRVQKRSKMMPFGVVGFGGERLELVEQLRSNFLYTERASKIVGFDLLLACCLWDDVTMAYFFGKRSDFHRFNFASWKMQSTKHIEALARLPGS